MVEQIPDVSNEEVDDITKIQYTKQEETIKICNQANKKLTRLSSTRIKIEELTHSSRPGIFQNFFCFKQQQKITIFIYKSSSK